MRWSTRSTKLPKTLARFSSASANAFLDALLVLPVLLTATLAVVGVALLTWANLVVGQAAEAGALAWQRNGPAAVAPAVNGTLTADDYQPPVAITLTQRAALATVTAAGVLSLPGWPHPVAVVQHRTVWLPVP